MTVQWLGLCAFPRRARVQSLFREPCFHNLHIAPRGERKILCEWWSCLLRALGLGHHHCSSFGNTLLPKFSEQKGVLIIIWFVPSKHNCTPWECYFWVLDVSALRAFWAPLADSIGEWCNNPFYEVGGQEVIPAYLSRGDFLIHQPYVTTSSFLGLAI